MIAHLRLEIAKLRREQYGRSSERRARLIEQMERSGLVSTMQSNGNREVLAPASASDAD